MNGQALAEGSTYLHSLPDGVDPFNVARDLEAMKARRTKKTVTVFAAVAIFAMIFGYFNNTDALSLLIIGIAAFIAGLFRELRVKEEHKYYLTVLATTLVATISATLLARVIPIGTPLIAIVIACIFLIPGFQLINGGWEIFRNHMHLGIPTIMVFVNVILIMGLGIIRE